MDDDEEMLIVYLLAVFITLALLRGEEPVKLEVLPIWKTRSCVTLLIFCDLTIIARGEKKTLHFLKMNSKQNFYV